MTAVATTVLLPVGAATVARSQEPPRPGASAARQSGTALWPSSRPGEQSAGDCGAWRLDRNGYCVADDARNGLEVGIRFRTARPVQVTGVRLYRVDPSRIVVSVWDEDRTRLATGALPPATATGWQDAALETPVTVVPGRLYTVSYFTPRTRYAFEYRYFSTRAHTVDPLTAPVATESRPNGVFCYDDARCGSYPVRAHRDTNYWVSPIWREEGAPVSTTPGSPTVEPTGGATPGADREPPVVVARTPRPGSRVGVRARVRVTFSEPLRQKSVSSRSLRLTRVAGDRAVRSRVTWSDRQDRAVLKPRKALARRTAYRMTVTPAVRDLAGNRLDGDPRRRGRQPVTWTFRTR